MFTNVMIDRMFSLPSVARLFEKGKDMCKEDALRRLDMDASIPDQVRMFFRQLPFDTLTVNPDGKLFLDNPVRELTYSDA